MPGTYISPAETGFYYLQSRYYDPEIGRVINADALMSTGQGFLGNNMFAYCNSNPILRSDTSGYISSLIRPNALCFDDERNCGYSGPYGKIEGLIHSQKTFEFADYPFGISTFSFSGCAVIAIYNSMQLYGKPQSLGAIRDEFLYEYGVVLYGLGGVDPFTTAKYFDAHRIAYTPYFLPFALDYSVSEGDIVVFTIMNNAEDISHGFHTMAAQYTNGQYMVYNVYTNGTKGSPFDSLDSIYENSVFIVGYLIGG